MSGDLVARIAAREDRAGISDVVTRFAYGPDVVA